MTFQKFRYEPSPDFVIENVDYVKNLGEIPHGDELNDETRVGETQWKVLRERTM